MGGPLDNETVCLCLPHVFLTLYLGFRLGNNTVAIQEARVANAVHQSLVLAVGRHTTPTVPSTSTKMGTTYMVPPSQATGASKSPAISRD